MKKDGFYKMVALADLEDTLAFIRINLDAEKESDDEKRKLASDLVVMYTDKNRNKKS